MLYKIVRTSPDELYHYGISGQKHGHRRFQNTDGTWTPEGQKRYSTDTDGEYGEPGGERSTPSQRKNMKSEKHKKDKIRRERHKNRGKKVVESKANASVKAPGSQRLMNVGFKALNAYLAYDSFKAEWS